MLSRRRFGLSFAAVAGVASGSAACAGDAPPRTPPAPRRAALVHDIPPGHPRLPYFDDFRDAVAARSGDGIRVRLNPDGMVLAGRGPLDAVSARRAEIAGVNMAHLEAIEPQAGFMNLPFGLDDSVMGDAGTRAAVCDILGSQMRPHDITLLGVMRGADQLFAFPRDDVRRLEDLRGKTIRVAGGGIYEQVMRRLGARPVAIPIPEIREAMSRGRVDGVFTSPGGWSTEVIDDAPHALHVPGLMLITYALIADRAWLAGLPAAEREAVIAAGAGMTDAWGRMRDDDRREVDAAVDGGATHVTAPSEEVTRWRAEVEGITADFFADHPAVDASLRRAGVVLS
jgi:TRAP-type C4-dicarboxylate transport system substrate-binding protein